MAVRNARYSTQPLLSSKSRRIYTFRRSLATRHILVRTYYKASTPLKVRKLAHRKENKEVAFVARYLSVCLPTYLPEARQVAPTQPNPIQTPVTTHLTPTAPNPRRARPSLAHPQPTTPRALPQRRNKRTLSTQPIRWTHFTPTRRRRRRGLSTRHRAQTARRAQQ